MAKNKLINLSKFRDLENLIYEKMNEKLLPLECVPKLLWAFS